MTKKDFEKEWQEKISSWRTQIKEIKSFIAECEELVNEGKSDFIPKNAKESLAYFEGIECIADTILMQLKLHNYFKDDEADE